MHLTTRSKEEALLADERMSLYMTFVAVCVGLSQVPNSIFCDGRSTCSVLARGVFWKPYRNVLDTKNTMIRTAM